MNSSYVQAISREIYRRFPEVQGKKPKIELLNLPKSRAITRSPLYLLTYQAQVAVTEQKNMPYRVRVMANEQGKILKISVSH